ncbi:MAG: hypothetical protein ACLT29_04080 [Ruminococcus callidus]
MSLFTGAVLLGVVLAALTVGVWWKKTNVLELLVLGVVYWLCTWVISGMGLFVLDQFSLRRCVIAAVSVELLVGIAAVLVRKLRDKTPWKQLVRISWNVRAYWIPAVVLAGGFVLVAFKHELFGMGQDEGVYQTVAVNFLNGITDRQQDFAEYHTLSKEQQELFHDKVFSYLVGYDLETEDYPATVYDRNVSPVSGIYHGIPTYASMLAMWGKLFGMAQMQDVQTVFYGCTIFLVFFLCRNLKLRRSSTALACAAAAASPVVIWVEKSALTESFLAVLLVLFLYLLTDEEHPYRQWLSIIPIAVFSCFHVSIYTMIPLFVVLYGGMFWITRRKSFAILMPVTLVGYCISFFAMRHVQPFYTMNNYRPFFVAGISQKDLPTLIPAVCAGALVLIGLYLFLMHRLVHRKYRDITPRTICSGYRTPPGLSPGGTPAGAAGDLHCPEVRYCRRAAGETSGQRLLGLYLRHRAAAPAAGVGHGHCPSEVLSGIRKTPGGSGGGILLRPVLFGISAVRCGILLLLRTVSGAVSSHRCGVRRNDHRPAACQGDAAGHGSRAAVRVAL